MKTLWPLATDKAAEIDDFWEKRRKEKPSLFNGHTFIAKSVFVEEGTIVAELYDAPYKALLYWKHHLSSDPGVYHLISVPIVLTQDGALVLGEMGAKNATGGLIYPPCGTFSMEDVGEHGLIADRECAVRELKEETGLDCDMQLGQGGVLALAGRTAVIVRRCQLAEPTEVVRQKINAFLESETDPELARMHFVTGVGQIPSEKTVPYVEKVIQQLFGTPPNVFDLS